jgi:toxin-antitoxin system PIN domain toxin
MILPDVNLLVYAHDRTSPYHTKAREWWLNVLSGTEPIGLPWIVLLGFVRILTHPGICHQPLSVEDAREAAESWFQSPCLRILPMPSEGMDVFFDLLADAGMGGNLSTDAMIAMHARIHSGIIYSNDRDFDRFPGIKWINPLL